MKVKQCKLKEDILISFTPEEIWDLIVICESSMVHNKDTMRQYPEGSMGYTEHKRLFDIAERIQTKIIDNRNKYGVIEEVEVSLSGSKGVNKDV